MDDMDFWLMLEYDMSGRFYKSLEKEMRKYWIDGFTPQFIDNTKTGVEVRGDIWVAERSNAQIKYRFLARVPQKLLHRKIRDFNCEIVVLNVARKYVELNIETRKPNKAIHQTR